MIKNNYVHVFSKGPLKFTRASPDNETNHSVKRPTSQSQLVKTSLVIQNFRYLADVVKFLHDVFS